MTRRMSTGIMHRSGIGRERGVVLITAIGLVVIMGLAGAIAAYMSTTNRRISGHARTSTEAFYAAEAGTEEARARLSGSAGANQIQDNARDSLNWRAFLIAVSAEKDEDDLEAAAVALGYDEDNAEHVLVPSLQNTVEYAVLIQHAVDDGQVAFWGDPDGDGVFTRNTAGSSDTNMNIYQVTSQAPLSSLSSQSSSLVASRQWPQDDMPAVLTAARDLGAQLRNLVGTASAALPGALAAPGMALTRGLFSLSFPLTTLQLFNTSRYQIAGAETPVTARRSIGIETVPPPPPPAPGPLYVEAPTNILGSSTYILGADQANPGAEACGEAAVHGISTSLEEDDDPIRVNGNPTITGDPDIEYDAKNIDIQAMIDVYKTMADFKYTVHRENLSGNESPGPGDGWGTPTIGASLQDPSSCDDSYIIHIDTQDTYVRLTGHTHGCGILLVEGDLDVHGGFSWYGGILVSGHILYSGGGDKQVTGTILSEGSADIDIIGGNANIVYCSDAVKNVNANRPLRILNWVESF